MSLSYRVPSCLVALVALAVCICQSEGAAPPQAAKTSAPYDQALQLLQSGKTSEALAAVDAALTAGARDPALYNLKGLAAGELGRNDEAEESFRTVIRLAPESALGYNNLGVLLAKLGRYREAVTAFDEARTREPQNFTTLLDSERLSRRCMNTLSQRLTWKRPGTCVPGIFGRDTSGRWHCESSSNLRPQKRCSASSPHPKSLNWR